MQLSTNAPTISSRGHIAQLLELAQAFAEDRTTCGSYHYGYSCAQARVKQIAGQILKESDTDRERNFATHALALYQSIHFSGCLITHKSYAGLCQRNVLRYLFSAPTQSAGISDTELQTINMAFMNYKGSLAVTNGSYLNYAIEWRRTALLHLRLNLVETPSKESAPVHPPLELLALRLHCIMQNQSMQRNQGMVAAASNMGGKIMKSIGLGFLLPERSELRELTYVKRTDYIGIAMDSQSTGPIKSYYELPSSTNGAIRITLRPGKVDDGRCYYSFNVKSNDLFTPEQLWDLREKLLREFSSGGVALKGIISIFKTFLEPICVDGNSTLIFTNKITAVYLHTLIPLCLQMQLQRDQPFVQTLVNKCMAAKDKELPLLLDDLATLQE